MIVDASTERLNQIASDIEEDGLYTSANSIREVARQRDELLEQVVILQSQLRIARWKSQTINIF